MAGSSTALKAFLALWCGIAVWQTSVALSHCSASSQWAVVFWLLHGGCLAAPLFACRRVLARPGAPPVSATQAALWLTLLTYVPISVAMKLVHLCGASR